MSWIQFLKRKQNSVNPIDVNLISVCFFWKEILQNAGAQGLSSSGCLRDWGLGELKFSCPAEFSWYSKSARPKFTCLQINVMHLEIPSTTFLFRQSLDFKRHSFHFTCGWTKDEDSSLVRLLPYWVGVDGSRMVDVFRSITICKAYVQINMLLIYYLISSCCRLRKY